MGEEIREVPDSAGQGWHILGTAWHIPMLLPLVLSSVPEISLCVNHNVCLCTHLAFVASTRSSFCLKYLWTVSDFWTHKQVFQNLTVSQLSLALNYIIWKFIRPYWYSPSLIYLKLLIWTFPNIWAYSHIKTHSLIASVSHNFSDSYQANTSDCSWPGRTSHQKMDLNV